MKMKTVVMIVIMLCFLPSFTLAQVCDYSVEILTQGTEFTKDSFKWRMIATKLEGKSTNITGTARIEDSTSTVIKNYKPWTNQSISKQKTSNEYSPNLKEGGYKIVSEISVDCDDINKGNNIDVRTISIKPGNSEIQEINISAQQFIFENKEQQTAINQTQENKLIKNLSIENQNDAIQTSKNNPEEYENTVTLKNENGQKSSIPTVEFIKSNKEAYAYVSSNEKTKNLIIYFLLAISIIFNIVLIWRR